MLINGIILSRINLTLYYNKHLGPTTDHKAWGRYYLVTVWLNGIAWGLPAIVLQSHDLTLTFFYALMIGGFVAGAIPGLSFNLKAYIGFALFSITPLILRLLFFEETFFHILAFMSALFAMINIASARISHHRIRNQIHVEYENKELVERLIAEKERAERATAVKSQFLAAASHDLRQPMHALGLFVDALGKRQLDLETGALVDQVKASTLALSELLNALLDISRLDAGVIQPEKIDFPLHTLFNQLELEFASVARERAFMR